MEGFLGFRGLRAQVVLGFIGVLGFRVSRIYGYRGEGLGFGVLGGS